MIDFKKMIENESVEDVLLFFAPKRSYPDIDRIYVRYSFEVAAKRELLISFQRLIKEGKLAKNEKGHAIKGPYWQEPVFVTEKRYGIE
uniref:hypothetical protein n=1 Tax=Pantoea sp. IMH TaxID=1267600 RepID=UPI00046A7D34|nr:hypothetical protein [Pantoea sp. IMH]